MATPTFRSFQNILKSLVQEYTFKTGITDLNKGSVTRSLLEAIALSDYKTQIDIMTALGSTDIERATGVDLDNIGLAKKVTRLQARESNGTITIYQKNFKKIVTKIYQGTAAPPAGSLTINVADITNFPSNGAVYIGRGTNNLEGPIPYTSIVSLGAYFQLVLSSPTTKNHNVGESVILAQGGNRIVPAGSLVQTKSSVTSNSIAFRVINTVTLLDGEEEIKDVPVVCTQVGTIGNIPANAIVEFASEPFPNAAATNPLAFVNGRDIMPDVDYRELIKKAEQSRVKGTDLAIIQAAVGVKSLDDNKVVTSAEIRKPSNREEPSILYIDDSTGYQPIFSGQGFEQIIDNSNGGEKFLQLQKEDITKATVVSVLKAPFAITGGMKLAVKVGGVLSEHIFNTSDFITENAVDVFEIVNSINNNPSLLFKARGFENNKRVVLFAKDFRNEDIQVVKPSSGVDANDFLGFPTTLTYTLRLYKNDELLIKDGFTPVIYSNPQSVWNNTIADGATLKVKVDQTNFQSIVINNTDFVSYGFSTVSKNNSLDAWAKVLTNKIAGITVEVEGNRLKMTSNKGANDNARLEISSDIALNSLAQSDNMWEPSISEGISSDYSLNRSTGQVELVEPAKSGDVFTAGSKFTRGFIDSGIFTSGSVTLSSSPTPKLYFIVDADATKVNVSLNNTITVSITNPSTNVWRYTFSASNVINGVIKDDIVIVTDNISISSNNVGYWRINNVDVGGSWFEIIKTTGTVEGPIVLTGSNDFIFIRSSLGEIQAVSLPTGVQTLNSIANSIKTLKGLTAEVVGGKKIRVSTLSFDNNIGKIFLAAQNITAATLGFTTGDSDKSEISHTAFNVSQTDLTFIEFLHDTITNGDNTQPFTSITTATNLDVIKQEPNNKIVFLNPFGANISSNRKLNADIENINNTNLTLRDSAKLKEIITNDRYYISTPFNFNYNDNIVIILDGDTINKTFNIKLGRKAKIYQSLNASVFRAYDVDFAPTANFPSSFGDNFSFADFKIHLKARAILDPAGPNNKMMIRSAVFGPSGNRIKVGIFYPQTEDASLNYSVTTGDFTNIKILLSSGSLRTGGTWDATTQFDVSNISANTWRYNYNGNGTAPNFLSAGIVVGDLVNISSNSTFDAKNTGVFKVTNITNTYFEVTNYNGVAENNKTLSVSSSLKFYPLNAANNTTILIGNLFNLNSQASEYITISQLESGVGVVSTSTLDDSNGATEFLQLQDGENWISASNIGTNISPINEFTLKRPLNIFGADLLNEEFYIIPTRSSQLKRFLNKFSVTGLSSLGFLSEATDAKAIQVYSSFFGSSGSVFVTGGSGNNVVAAVNETAVNIDNSYTKFGIAKSASTGFHRGQWIKITNNNKAPKDLKFISATQLSWDSQNPLPTQSTITINNSNSSNIYQHGYFWTKRYHDANATTGIRLEKHGQFIALMWNGIGTEPKFNKNFTITNISRTSNISTVTLSSAHGIPIGNSVEIVVNTTTNTSFNGIFRAVASSATELQYRQDGLANVVSTPASGTITRKVRKNDRIILSGAFLTANKGEFLVANVFGDNTIYFENPNAIEEDVILSSNSDIQFYDYESVRPGDIFSVGSTILNSTSPFESHQGDFVVADIGPTENSIIVNSTTIQDVSLITLGANFNTIKVIEKDLFLMYAKIHNTAPSPSNINTTDIIIESTELPNKINPSLGSSIATVSKLSFSSDVKVGEDSYKFYGGLISAVGQVIRGKPSDPISFPGVAAAGSFIEIDSSLPKRIQLSIVIRNRTGTPFTIIKNRVQSIVAAYVNSLGVGKPVVFSEIITAAQAIEGVQAVSISSPTYDSTNDQIISQPDQKPIIFNLDQDVIVSQAT